jgi:hypothetical protein
MARSCGWKAVLSVAFGSLFLIVTWYSVVFPEIAVLTWIFGPSGLLLAIGGLISGYNWAPNAVRRNYEREKRRIAYAAAESIGLQSADNAGNENATRLGSLRC